MGTHDDESFPVFVREQWGPLTRTAFLLTGDRNHAEDLVQTALEKTHRKWRGLDTPAAYVRRVMVNTATSWRRRRSFGEVPYEPADGPADRDAYEQIEQRQQLFKALRRLPPRMRAVLVLRYWDDLPDSEIAQILGCSVSTVKSQASRGTQRLREYLSLTETGLSTVVQEVGT